MKVEILEGPEQASFGTLTKRTAVPQREKLEHIMKNLCGTLGISTIYWQVGSRGAKFYRPDARLYSYQSASNTILELSEKVAEKFMK